MAYPPGNQGFYGAYTPRPTRSDHGSTPLPQYAGLAVASLGALTYLVSYGPAFEDVGLGWSVRFAVLAAVAAGLGLLPRQSPNTKVIAAIAAVGFLEALSDLITAPGDRQGWAAVAIVVATGLQALAAIWMLVTGPDGDDTRAGQFQYQAYAEYYARAAQYYGQYGEQQPTPETSTQMGSAYAQQAQRAAVQQQESGSSTSSYADYVAHLDQAAGPAPSASWAQHGTPPGAQAGLPNFGQAQGPAQPHGGNAVSEQRPSPP